jgi:hypothetical protein
MQKYIFLKKWEEYTLIFQNNKKKCNDEVGDIVAVAQPSGGLAGAREINAVVGLVCPRYFLPR